ncbi:MAG: hypothetical protein VXZ73_04535 [Pseudomonadota bacterium]|nr:hypothetical protein [Pseudomonadota bacterium]
MLKASAIHSRVIRNATELWYVFVSALIPDIDVDHYSVSLSAGMVVVESKNEAVMARLAHIFLRKDPGVIVFAMQFSTLRTNEALCVEQSALHGSYNHLYAFSPVKLVKAIFIKPYMERNKQVDFDFSYQVIDEDKAVVVSFTKGDDCDDCNDYFHIFAKRILAYASNLSSAKVMHILTGEKTSCENHTRNFFAAKQDRLVRYDRLSLVNVSPRLVFNVSLLNSLVFPPEFETIKLGDLADPVHRLAFSERDIVACFTPRINSTLEGKEAHVRQIYRVLYSDTQISKQHAVGTGDRDNDPGAVSLGYADYKFFSESGIRLATVGVDDLDVMVLQNRADHTNGLFILSQDSSKVSYFICFIKKLKLFKAVKFGWKHLFCKIGDGYDVCDKKNGFMAPLDSFTHYVWRTFSKMFVPKVLPFATANKFPKIIVSSPRSVVNPTLNFRASLWRQEGASVCGSDGAMPLLFFTFALSFYKFFRRPLSVRRKVQDHASVNTPLLSGQIRSGSGLVYSRKRCFSSVDLASDLLPM